MADEFCTIGEHPDLPPLSCTLCGNEEHLRQPLSGYRMPIMCTLCFREWYDGDLNARLRSLGRAEVAFKEQEPENG